MSCYHTLGDDCLAGHQSDRSIQDQGHLGDARVSIVTGPSSTENDLRDRMITGSVARVSQEGVPTIRPAVVADAGGIAEVHVRSWQAAYAGQLPDELLAGLSVSGRRRGWERILGDPDRSDRTLVLDLGNGSIRGFANAGGSRDDGVGDDVAELRAIYLHPNYWDQGLGRRLHDQVLVSMSDDGYRTVTLWVLDTNARARRFYERAGWSRDGATKIDHVGDVALNEVRYATSLDEGR